MIDSEIPIFCAACGRQFDGDPDEDPTGEAGLPLCGPCDRARNFDADLELLDDPQEDVW